MSLPEAIEAGHGRRRRLDLRRLPYGLGYFIALAVSAIVIFLAHRASRGQAPAPWWTDYASPAIYWSSPFLVALVIVLRFRRWKRRRAAGDKIPK